MAYTDIDDPSEYFQTKIYTGNGGTQSITNGGNSDIQPDWIWTKSRSYNDDHLFVDSVRGVTKYLKSHVTNAEQTSTIRVTAFNSDGFSLGSSSDINGNNDTYVGWQWKAGTSFSNDASATSVGSIDSVGSVNTDAGFSIISYTGTGANATIAHGLGSVPKMYIARNITDAENWTTYHVGMGATKHLRLNTNVAQVDEAEVWNDTEPTSTVFSVGSSGAPNGDGDAHIAYCFAEKQGYSKFGSYVGNGAASDGPFSFCGFKPAFVLTKPTTRADDWRIFDNKRSTSGENPNDKMLFPHTNGVEGASSSDSVPDGMDFLSNGFKIRQETNGLNSSGDTYIYMAFAENPFVTSKGVPATAK